MRSLTTRALVLARVAYAESDLIVTLFTEELGRLGALARGARKSQRRFGGALEPFHMLSAVLDERPTSDLLSLREASLETVRDRLCTDLDRLEAAGRACAWVRHAAPPRTPEPEVWRALNLLLDRLETSEAAPLACLAEQGLHLLAAFGWGLDLERCVRCGRPCEPARAAFVDATAGGLVCRTCGGARLRLSGPTRERIARANAGEDGALLAEDVPVALDLVEATLRAHAGTP